MRIWNSLFSVCQKIGEDLYCSSLFYLPSYLLFTTILTYIHELHLFYSMLVRGCCKRGGSSAEISSVENYILINWPYTRAGCVYFFLYCNINGFKCNVIIYAVIVGLWCMRKNNKHDFYYGIICKLIVLWLFFFMQPHE